MREKTAIVASSVDHPIELYSRVKIGGYNVGYKALFEGKGLKRGTRNLLEHYLIINSDIINS